MAYVWVEEPEEGADVRDVVAREDYDQIVTERDGLVEQRDALIERAETAEEMPATSTPMRSSPLRSE